MNSQSPRVALIHATPLAIQPIQDAFARHWPQAQRMNLLDDTLSSDRARTPTLTQGMVQRFVDLARYAQGTGCTAILFTCSAFGPAIEAAGRATGLPTLKPNEAMFEQALSVKKGPLKLALLATFEASLSPMAWELQQLAQQRGTEVELRTAFVPEAMDDLAHGRAELHHRKVADAARQFAGCDAVMLAQFSMAAAQPVVQAAVPCPVFSSPDCAVLALQQRMAAHG